jgi:Tfp pilus assembly protein PilN
VRAVNLLPSDLRRAGSGGGSGSGAGAYGLLAALAVAVALVGLWATSARQVKDREAEVTELNAEAQAAEAQAANLAGYEGTVKIANTRRSSVVGLIEKRFDWSKAFEDISRTVPEHVWISTMSATASPGITIEGGNGGSNTQRPSHNGPAIELTGCTTGQDAVARLMARLRAMKGVTRVGLSTSEKSETTNAGTDAGNGAANGDCTAGSSQRPKFNLIVFYGDGAAETTPGASGSAAANNTAAVQQASGGNQ